MLINQHSSNENMNDIQSLEGSTFDQIRILAIAKTNINAKNILEQLDTSLPNISELQIVMNSVSHFHGSWKDLLTLSLEANTILLDSLAELLK